MCVCVCVCEWHQLSGMCDESVLLQMLSEASERAKAKKELADSMEGVTVIAPTIQRTLLANVHIT